MSQNKTTVSVEEQSSRISIASSRLLRAEHLLSLQGDSSPSEAELRRAHAELDKSIDCLNRSQRGGLMLRMMKVARLNLKDRLPEEVQAAETTS